ncbi:uncharacterized protein LOC105828351 isoform X2 [Monomorium pharaonis]|nr:uncharacterized protein LOC105828351 isoform X2 [Monomorium pharaonis]
MKVRFSMTIRNELNSPPVVDGRGMNEIYSQPVKFVPPVPRCRRPIRLEGAKESLNNNFQNLQMEKKASKQKTTSNQSEKCIDPSSSYDTQVSENSTEEDEETHSPNTSSHHFQNYSVTSSPEKSNNKKSLETKQNKNSYCSNIICITLVIIVFASLFQNFQSNEVQTQSISPTLLAKSIEDIKTIFYNQESDIWNDISSAINEVISKTPKTPSIILLFAKETITMNCLAIKLAQASSAILSTAHKPLEFNPKDFGNDPGEIITTLNEYPPEKKRVMIIRDILNINVEAIKALHNLCDRVNPLVAEAIYILTMQTNNYQPSQKKLNFVEKQIFNKLSKSIDRDVLMALVTRITDGAIIS